MISTEILKKWPQQKSWRNDRDRNPEEMTGTEILKKWQRQKSWRNDINRNPEEMTLTFSLCTHSSSAWSSSLFLEFEFHRLSKCRGHTLHVSSSKIYKFFILKAYAFAQLLQVLARETWEFQFFECLSFLKNQIIELKFSRVWVLMRSETLRVSGSSYYYFKYLPVKV